MYITDKIRNMKHLTFLLLFFSVCLSGQINDKFYTEERYHLNIDSAFIWSVEDYKNEYAPKLGQIVTIEGGNGIKVISSFDNPNITIETVPLSTIKDTIKVEILVSIEGALKVINGYDVRKHKGSSYISYDGYGNRFENVNYEHELYLDENKKPLNKNYTIWQTIRK